MTDIIDTTPATESPAQETIDMAIVVSDAADNGKKVFKPHGEEFALDREFAAVAAALNLATESITWTIEDDAINGIDGKSLVGRPA